MDLDLTVNLSDLIRIVLAGVIALPVALEREKENQIMGLRTFPLVAVAACSYVLLTRTVIVESSDAIARVVQGLITGIGFIGGGAILKKDDDGLVQGTATAASIWTTGAVGAAVAFGRIDIAIIISLITYAILRLFAPLKDRVGPE